MKERDRTKESINNGLGVKILSLRLRVKNPRHMFQRCISSRYVKGCYSALHIKKGIHYVPKR